MDLLDECFNEVFSKPLRCKKCFITHFPWMKICKRNNPVGWKRINAVETNVMVPKLRGGGNLPKYFETDNQEMRDILTVLRSLDVLTQHYGHPKCQLKSKSELCKFCLIRSMVIKSRSNKGPKKMKPIEINVLDQEILENMDLFKSILIILDDELHLCGKIFNERCSECFPEESHFFLHLKHPSIEGKDAFDLLREKENEYRRDHEDHDRLKQDKAEVIVKLRQGSGKDRQGMVVKAKGLKA